MLALDIETAVQTGAEERPLSSADARPVLVTGATGFTGGYLVRRLLAEGERIRVLVRRTSDTSSLPASVEIVTGDLRDRAAVERAVDRARIVFHVAAAFREARLSPAEYAAINVDSTGTLVRAAARSGVSRFVHCSTGGVHGHVERPPADEEAPLAPGDWYQETKLRGERLAREVAGSSGLALTVARPTGIYGPGDRRLFKLFVTIARERFVMFGAGQVQYHMTYIDDVVDGLVRCGSVSRAAGRTYLLGGPESATSNELVQTIARVAGVRPPSRRWPLGPARLAAAVCEAVCVPLRIEPPLHHRRVDFFVKNRAFDISRARRELGFEPKVGLEDGLRRTFEWYRAAGWL